MGHKRKCQFCNQSEILQTLHNGHHFHTEFSALREHPINQASGLPEKWTTKTAGGKIPQPTNPTISIEMLNNTRVIAEIPPQLSTAGSYSNLFGSLLKVRTVQRGKISCLVSVKPPIMNIYHGMHGGAVASISELMAIACARTLVGEQKDLFLGDIRTSYLSSAPKESKVVVDGSVIRSGRNITVVAIEFKLEESSKLVYTSQATSYHLPNASL